jgi:hypothetical protein
LGKGVPPIWISVDRGSVKAAFPQSGVDFEKSPGLARFQVRMRRESGREAAFGQQSACIEACCHGIVVNGSGARARCPPGSGFAVSIFENQDRFLRPPNNFSSPELFGAAHERE